MSEAKTGWDDLAEWWRGEAADDPVYGEDVWPLLVALMPRRPATLVELGCGEGQWLRRLAGDADMAFGCDASMALLADAVRAGPVVRCVLPELGWLRDGSVDAAVSVFVLDLIPDEATFFAEAARVVRPGGALVLVVNHPVFTAPGSGPVVDLDGEVLWRWGEYLADGTSEEPAGGRSVTFFHRPSGTLLSVAAEAGWILEALHEVPIGRAAVERDPGYAGQEDVPRLLGARWRRSSGRA